jgi:hypothetical protein
LVYFRYIEKPVITLDKRTILVANGDSAALVCPATGVPTPEITWYKSNEEVRQIQRRGKSYSFVRSTKT